MIAFKDYPEIIEAYANLWFPKDNCIRCSLPFVRKTHNQKYCSYECKRPLLVGSRQKCPSCSKQFHTKSSSHTYCSIYCRKIFDKKRKGVMTQKQQIEFERAIQQKFLTELKTVECSFCGNEYEQHKSSKAKYCCDFCRRAAVKFKE